jgi:two-component system alkaline phosphatase synthesis response regulator PhoP
MSKELILLVDDEPHIVELAQLYLEKEGYRTISASDGKQALDSIEKQSPALVVLDLMLPEIDGFEVCRQLRAQNNSVLILMLTARDDDVDKIVGLEMGADDYMTKPFNPRELLARVKALLRRSSKIANSAAPIHLGDMTIDNSSRELTVNGEKINLRTQEFDLLWTFAEHKGLVLKREQLLILAWGYDYYGETRTVDVHVAHLRKKIKDSSVKIETLTGVGYKLVI